ncbi:MAG: hypothetical protein IPI78_11855 [Chitinophagaceae bacterium]|nr:hypothetical protein [Chitinophagaceae bacterium]
MKKIALIFSAASLLMLACNSDKKLKKAKWILLQKPRWMAKKNGNA